MLSMRLQRKLPSMILSWLSLLPSLFQEFGHVGYLGNHGLQNMSKTVTLLKLNTISTKLLHGQDSFAKDDLNHCRSVKHHENLNLNANLKIFVRNLWQLSFAKEFHFIIHYLFELLLISLDSEVQINFKIIMCF